MYTNGCEYHLNMFTAWFGDANSCSGSNVSLHFLFVKYCGWKDLTCELQEEHWGKKQVYVLLLLYYDSILLGRE